LQELAKKQRFRPSDEVATFKILKSIKEVIGTAVPVILSAKEEFLWLSNREGDEFSEIFGIIEAEKELIERGGQSRGITDISYRLIDVIRSLLDIGAGVRHFSDYRLAHFGVFDKKYCISAINIDVQHPRLDEPLSMLYPDDPVFADYLVSTFEMLWKASCSGGTANTRAFRTGAPAGLSQASLGKMPNLAHFLRTFLVAGLKLEVNGVTQLYKARRTVFLT